MYMQGKNFSALSFFINWLSIYTLDGKETLTHKADDKSYLSQDMHDENILNQ